MKLTLYKKNHAQEGLWYHIAKDEMCIFSTRNEAEAGRKFEELKNADLEQEIILEEWDSEQTPPGVRIVLDHTDEKPTTGFMRRVMD